MKDIKSTLQIMEEVKTNNENLNEAFLNPIVLAIAKDWRELDKDKNDADISFGAYMARRGVGMMWDKITDANIELFNPPTERERKMLKGLAGAGRTNGIVFGFNDGKWNKFMASGDSSVKDFNEYRGGRDPFKNGDALADEFLRCEKIAWIHNASASYFDLRSQRFNAKRNAFVATDDASRAKYYEDVAAENRKRYEIAKKRNHALKDEWFTGIQKDVENILARYTALLGKINTQPDKYMECWYDFDRITKELYGTSQFFNHKVVGHDGLLVLIHSYMDNRRSNLKDDGLFFHKTSAAADEEVARRRKTIEDRVSSIIDMFDKFEETANKKHS